MNSSKSLLLVRLARDFQDLPEAAIVEVVSTLAMLHTGGSWHSVEDQARGLLTTIRWSTRRRGAPSLPVTARQRAAGRATDTA